MAWRGGGKEINMDGKREEKKAHERSMTERTHRKGVCERASEQASERDTNRWPVLHSSVESYFLKRWLTALAKCRDGDEA